MKTISDDGKIRITDLEVRQGFLGSVVIFDANNLYISGPSSISEFIFFEHDRHCITHDFETLPTLSDVGYITDISICDINKNLIAIGSVALKEDKPSIFCIYDTSKKDIILVHSNYAHDRKFIWKEDVLYFKGIRGKGNYCFDTRPKNQQSNGVKELDDSYDTIFESHKLQTNKIKLKVIKEFNLQPVNLLTFESKCLAKLKLFSKGGKVNINLDRRYSDIKSVIANLSFDKFVLLLGDESYVLVELQKN
jgi:hypothetical protein